MGFLIPFKIQDSHPCLQDHGPGRLPSLPGRVRRQSPAGPAPAGRGGRTGGGEAPAGGWLRCQSDQPLGRDSSAAGPQAGTRHDDQVSGERR